MFWLGLAATVSAPGYIGTSIPAGWAMLSGTMPLALWRKGEVNFLHWAGLAFLAYAALSLAWTPNRWDGGWALWQLAIVALSFWLGSTGDLRSVWRGLGVGISVSSIIAIVQWLGYNPVIPMAPGATPGLYFNTMAAGEATALVMVALWNRRMFGLIPFLLPGLYLAHSRGAWLALFFGIIAVEFRSILFLASLCAFVVPPILLLQTHSDLVRFDIWQATILYLTPFGNGAGSFLSLFLPPIHPEFAHNDYLQLAFEYGIGAIPILFLVSWTALQPRSDEWPILITFLFMALFSFPLHSPLTAFMGALAAGSVARDWSRVWDRGPVRRPDFMVRVELPAGLGASARGENVPF